MEYLRRHRQNMSQLLSDLYRHKDGDEIIIPTRRHRVAYNEGIGIQSYILDDLNFSDAGSYSCNAVNTFGHINTCADLDIQDVRNRRKKKDDLNVDSRYITYDDSHVDPHSPPIITLPLVDEGRTMGESVDFNIKVRSHTPVEVSWRHYEDMVLPSEKYSMKKDIDEYHLSISDLNLEDGGRWQCIAVNYFGQTETTCKLTVHNYTLEKYRAPQFTQELHNFVVSEGAEARFSCKVSAHPAAQVTWFKNRKVIENKGPYRCMQRSDDTFILTIDEVVREDIGYYMCQATNTAGTKSSEAKLAVETVEKPLSLLERNPLEKGHIKSERFGAEKSKYVCIPEFTTKLKNKTVPADSTVKLTCSVSGVPEPDIQWYRNGEKIYSSLNCCMRNNSGLVSLEIAVADHENEGQYICEATNSEGTVSCSSQITVEGVKKTVGGSSENEAPIFVETPLCSTVVVGGDAVFQCVSKGNPMPSFKWTKDGQNVDENDHCSLFVDSHGGCRLVIHNVQEHDAGLYMCMAHNNVGRTKCSTRLRIVGQEEVHEHRGLSKERVTSRKLQKFEKTADPDISNRMMMSGKPPFFTMMLPKLVEINEGEKLRLDCSLEGYPSLVVTWQKGVRELVYNARHRIIAYGTLQTLEIPSVLITDHGEYFVRAANVYGMIESSCLVKVNKKGKKMAEREYNKMKGPASRKRDAAEGDAPLQAPFFIKHLPYTIDVIEGTDLHLDCSVKGQPKGDIDGDYQRFERGVTGEEEEEEEEKDVESRTLEPAGDMTSDHTSASEVTSAPTASAAAAGSEEQTVKTDPSFTDKFDDTVVTEGQDAVLECKTSGDSDIRWLKDGEVINPSERINLIRNGCLHQLYIHGCTKADQAMYTCLSSNLNQSEACVAMLSVKKKTLAEDYDNSYADDLLKKWENKTFGSSYVPRARDKSYSPHRRSYNPSPERDRRFRSSSRDSDFYSAYGKYSGTSYDKYSDSSKTSGRYSSYEKPTDRYSSYEKPSDRYSSHEKLSDRYSSHEKLTDRYSSYEKPTDRYSSYEKPSDRYSSHEKLSDRYSSHEKLTDRYSSYEKPTDRYSSYEKPTERYSRYDQPTKSSRATDRYSRYDTLTDKYSTDRHSSKDRYSSTERYSTDRYSADRYSADRYSANRYSADRYSVDRYSADKYAPNKYSTDKYSNNRYSVERSSKTENNSTDRYSRDRYSRDRYSSERYLSPKPRSRYSSSERDYYSGSSRYEDKKRVSRACSPSAEDKAKTSDLLSEIKYMKADIEIRIEQADDLMIDEKIKQQKSKTDADVKTTDAHEKPDEKTLDRSMIESLDYKREQRPSSVERTDQALVYRAVTKSPQREEKEVIFDKLNHKTIGKPKVVETKKEETFEKLDQKTVERPTIVEAKKEETFEKLDQKTVERPTIVETKKEETFEKLDQKTVEKPTIVETKKEETFEKLDQKTVKMPTKVEEKKEETFEKLDQKTVERPTIVETKKEETFEKLDQKTVKMPTKVEEKKEETFEKLDQKTVERPTIVETKKEETFEKLDQKTVKMPTKVEDKEDASQKLEYKSVDLPTKVEDKVELDEKKMEAPIPIVENTKSDATEKTVDDKFKEKKSDDLGKVADQVPVSLTPLKPEGKINLSDEEKAKELIQQSKTVVEQSSNDLSKQPSLSFSERMIKNADNEYEIVMRPEKEVIIEEFPTFSMPPQESVEDVRCESSKLMGAAELVDTKTIAKDEPVDEIKTMSEQKLDNKTKDIEMGEEMMVSKEKIQTSIIKDKIDEKSEVVEAKEVSLVADAEVSGSLYQSEKDAAAAKEEVKIKSISEKEPTTTKERDTSSSLDPSQIDGDTILREKDMAAAEKKVQKEAESETDLSTQYADKLSSEVDEKKSKIFVEDEKDNDNIGRVDPELENFAQSIAKKIIEDDLKEQLKQLKAESKGQSTEDTSFEDEDKLSPEIMIDIGSDDDERDIGRRREGYIVEFPMSPADRRLSLIENPEDDLFIHGTGSPGSPVIEELRSPFRTSEDGEQGIVEEPSEEAFEQQIKTSSGRGYEAEERLTFDKKFDFEPNNVDQDVFESRHLDKETHQTLQKEEAGKDTKEDIERTVKDRNGYDHKDYMVKESGLKRPIGLDAEDGMKLDDHSECKVADGYERDIRAAVKEMQEASDYEDQVEISSENNAEVQQQSEMSQKRHSSRQSSFTNQTPESRSSTSSEQISTATGDSRTGRNLTSEDLPAEDDGVWTRKPIFSEDSLSYVSEQTSLSGDSHRGLETESNRTNSLERQLSDEETFLLRQTSDESDIHQQRSPDEVNVHQTQAYDDSFNRQKPDENRHKQSSKDAGIFYTDTTQEGGVSPRVLRKKIAEHLSYSGSAQQERDEHKRAKEHYGQYEEQENVQSDYQEECHHSEYAESDEESEGSDVTTRTAIIKKGSDRLSVDTGEFANESMDDDASDRSDSRRIKDMSPMSQDGVNRQTRFKSPGIEEMLKDRQFPPIFVKELPRLLEANIGDYLKMPCVIRYIAQIEWKKSGEKITRDKRRRMTSEDDGTQTLHIRPIQSDDGGIYACVAKENDGTTSQTECVLIIRAGKKAA